MESRYVLGDQFKADWSWRPRQTRTRIGLGLWLGFDVLAGLLRWWPRRRTSKPSQRPSPIRVRVCLGRQDQSAIKRTPRTHPDSVFNDPHMDGKTI